MSRRSALQAAILASVALAGMLLLRPIRPALSVDIYLLVLAAVALGALVEETRRSAPAASGSAFDPPPKIPPRQALRPSALERLEREVFLSSGDAFYLHHRLRPVFREIAEHRLADRRGLQLGANPDETRSVLGSATWSLLQPDRPAPKRFERGLPLEELTHIVEALERS